MFDRKSKGPTESSCDYRILQEVNHTVNSLPHHVMSIFDGDGNLS